MPLRFKLQFVAVADDGSETTEDVVILDKEHEYLGQLGLTLAEGKQLLREVQRRVLERQVTAFLSVETACPKCGRQRGTKDHKVLGLRTLFGKMTLQSARLRRCCRQPGESASVSPLSQLLSERSTPELRYLETRWASLVSYGLTVKALRDFLPIDEHVNVTTVRRTTLGVARRCEAELGPEQPMFAEGCQLDWDELPRPDLPLIVGLDGGYVHSSQQRSRRDGWFEVIAGKSMPTEGSPKCFGFVQTYDSKPKRRLFEVLKSQGMQMNQQVTFVTDGGDDVRDLPLYLNPQAEHLLDWFHVAMRLTVMHQMAKGLRSRENPELATQVAEELARLEVVPLARQRLPRVANGWGPRDGPRRRGHLPRAAQAAEDRDRVRRLHSRQRGLDTELRRAVSLRGDDLERLRRVDRQPGGEQADGQEAADALDA